jgi:multiple sugar transport system permease protein
LTASQAARKRNRRRTIVGLLFVSPWIIGFLVFFLYPFIMTFYYSFTNFNIVKPAHWVGLANYSALTKDHLFRQSLWNTAYYAVLEVPFSTIVAIGLAMLLNMKVRGLAIYRTALYLPTVVPLVASCLVWLWLFNPSFGIVNDALSAVHINGPGWMFSAAWSKPTFVLMGVWAVGAPMVIYLAALQGVPQEMYEVADLEGAGPWQRTRHVTLPMISPAILFNVVLALVAAFQYFTQAFVMTGGGPTDSTLFYSLYLYEQAFSYLHLGYASAMAWILFVIVVVVTLLFFRSSNRWVYYANE